MATQSFAHTSIHLQNISIKLLPVLFRGFLFVCLFYLPLPFPESWRWEHIPRCVFHSCVRGTRRDLTDPVVRPAEQHQLETVSHGTMGTPSDECRWILLHSCLDLLQTKWEGEKKKFQDNERREVICHLYNKQHNKRDLNRPQYLSPGMQVTTRYNALYQR